VLVQCPNCGQPIVVNGLGRKAFDIPVIKVYEFLQLLRSVQAAASELGCSRVYIYKVLKANGLSPMDIIRRSATKDNSLLHNEGLNNGR